MNGSYTKNEGVNMRINWHQIISLETISNNPALKVAINVMCSKILIILCNSKANREQKIKDIGHSIIKYLEKSMKITTTQCRSRDLSYSLPKSYQAELKRMVNVRT